MARSFSQFIRERQYLHNVSPATIGWYKHSFKWLRSERPTAEELADGVMADAREGAESGADAIPRSEQSLPTSSGPVQAIAFATSESRVLPTFTLPDIKKLLCHRPKPTNFYQRRLRLLILVLLCTPAAG